MREHPGYALGRPILGTFLLQTDAQLLIDELIIKKATSIGMDTNMLEDMITTHYLMRGTEAFCCIKNTWWKIAYRIVKSCTPATTNDEIVICAVTEVGPPKNVAYSHSSARGRAKLTPADVYDDAYGMIYDSQSLAGI